MNTKRWVQLSISFVLLASMFIASLGVANAQPAPATALKGVPASTTTLPPGITYGAFGGTITDLVMDPKTPTTLYAASDYGVFKTTDNGDNWSLTGLTSVMVNALVVDPTNSAVIYAGTRGQGFWKSSDGGATWTNSPNAYIQDKIVYTIVVDPNNSNNVYAGGREYGVDGSSSGNWGGGVFKSTDGGVTWNAMNNGLPGGYVYSLVIDPTAPTILYAGTDGYGVYKTFDSANDWVARNTNINTANSDNLKIRSIAMDPNNHLRLLMGVWGGASVFETNNGAENGWSNVGQNFYGQKVLTVAFNPVIQGYVYAGLVNGAPYDSTNGLYTSWNPMPGPITTNLYNQWGFLQAVNAFLVNPQNGLTLFIAVNGRGVFRSLDGGKTWAPTDQGLAATTVTAVVIDPKNLSHLYAATSGTGIFQSYNSGATWSSYSPLPSQWDNLTSLALDPTTAGTLYAGIGTMKGMGQSGIGYSTNNGQTWTYINGNIPQAPVPAAPDASSDLQPGDAGLSALSPGASQMTFPAVTAVAAAPTSPVLLYAGTSSHGTWYSTNTGSSWASVDNSSASVTSIQVYPNDPYSVLIATSNQGLFKATYTGGGFNRTYYLAGMNVQSAYIDTTTSPNTLYAGTTNGVYKSGDNGTTWNLAGLSGYQIDALTIDHPSVYQAKIFAGTTAGIYYTYVGGSTWNKFSNISAPISAIAVDPVGHDLVYAGTDGGGLASLSQSILYPTYLILSLFIRVVPTP